MKQFLGVFLGTPEKMETWRSLDEATRQAKEKDGMNAWRAWAEKNESRIRQMGSPLGKTKRVGMNGVTDVRNNMGAWVVVEAETHEEAAKMFENHPHFAIFPGDCVDVMECMPIPEMPKM